MARYAYHGIAQDQNGRAIPSATVAVFLAGTETAAGVYTASSGGSAVNSVTADSDNGVFVFYVDDTSYVATQLFKIGVTKTNYAGSEIDNVVIYPARTPRVVALTDAATIATNAGLGDIFSVTLGGNRTLGTPTNPIDGMVKVWKLRQDGSAPRTITLSAAFRTSDNITVTLSTGNNDIDYLGAIYDGTDSKWDVVMFEKNMA